MLSSPTREMRNSDHVLTHKIMVATVVDNNDPLNLWRVKFRCTPLHDGVDDAALPWARKDSSPLPGSSAAMGTGGAPAIGTKIRVQFQDNSDDHAIYISSHETEQTKLPDLLVDYPHSYGMIDPHNNLFRVNAKTGQIDVHHKSGTIITIAPNGAVTVTTASNAAFNVNGNASIKASGSLSLDGDDVAIRGNNVSIDGGSIKITGDIDINAGGSPTAPEAPDGANPR